MEILLAMEVPPEAEILLPREVPPMMKVLLVRKVLLEMVVLPVGGSSGAGDGHPRRAISP